MFPRKFRLCELFGIPLYLDFTLVILLLMFLTGGGGLFSNLLGAVFLLFSITAHELGHALTARAFGYHTRDITLSLLGGCASLIALPRRASQEFLTAIAGPVVSFALSFLGICGVAACAAKGGLGDAGLFVLEEILNSFGLNCSFACDIRVAPNMMELVMSMLYFAVMNGMLGFFNLLPGFPMDGGRIFRSAMRAFMSRTRATYIAMIVGRGIAILLAVEAGLRLYQGRSWGIVTFLIAWMIWREGYREYLQTLAESEWNGGDGWGFSARVSPPPYGGSDDETEIRRNR